MSTLYIFFFCKIGDVSGSKPPLSQLQGYYFGILSTFSCKTEDREGQPCEVVDYRNKNQFVYDNTIATLWFRAKLYTLFSRLICLPTNVAQTWRKYGANQGKYILTETKNLAP